MRRGRWKVLTLVALVGLVTGCGGGAAAPSPTAEETALPTAVPTPRGPQATVVDLINEVDAHALPEEDWVDALVDMVIYLGGEVWAREASTARVDVEEGLVRVAPNTIFTFGQPEPDTLELELDEGQVWVDVEGLAPGETFEVETPAAVASVRGTRFGARAAADGTTIVSTQVDTVTVAAATQVVTVTAGYQTTVVPGDPPAAPQPMSNEEQVRWGMAVGSELDMALPAVGDSHVLTATGFYFHNFDWSPDGAYSVMSYYHPFTEAYTNTFYDARAGTTIPSPLPRNVNGVLFNPAGDGLAYQSWGSDYSSSSICTAGIDGSNPSCFGGDAVYGWPFWSPDGEWVVFYSNRRTMGGGPLLSLPGPGHEDPGRVVHPLDAGTEQADDDAFNLFRARPDGSDMTPLTFDEGGNNIRQAWSPQGDSIAFVYAAEYMGPGDVWVMNADGSDARMLFDGIYGNG
ncbi:MAG: FecR domain-containing protein, partial [Anaerolineae bacterium]